MICFLSFFIALVLAAKSQEYAGPAQALYFREFSLTNGARPVPQLVCKNTEPVDGCAQLHVRVVECTRDAEELQLQGLVGGQAINWLCKSHEDRTRLLSKQSLEFTKLEIKCENVLDAETCSLVYTFQHDANTQKRIAAQKLYDECSAVCTDSVLTVIVSVLCTVTVAIVIAAALWACSVVAFTKGYLCRHSRFVRIMEILLEKAEDSDDEENGKVEKKN